MSKDIFEEAFNYGRRWGTDTPCNADQTIPQTADYANNVLPELRKLAGYKDSGYGTYRIPPEDRESETSELYRELIDMFWEGFYSMCEESKFKEE